MRLLLLLALCMSCGSSGASDAGVDAGELLAPTITAIHPVGAGLHLAWTNSTKTCEAIEGERKSGMTAFALVFTIPDGSVDNKHDQPLTSGATYTYRLRCKRAAAYSPYSNEMSGTSP